MYSCPIASEIMKKRSAEDAELEEESASPITPSRVIISPHDSKRPRFLNQRTLESTGVVKFDAENTAALQTSFLTNSELQAYIEAATKVDRFRGKSAFNSEKPRREVCYTVDGTAFLYSGHAHPTTRYPPHTKPILERMREYYRSTFPGNAFKRVSASLDILYSSEFPGGGKAGAHGDNEQPWGLVLILSLGQTRWLRIRRKEGGREWLNIEMKHNSLISMHGQSFQLQYTHQVDRLNKTDVVYPRLSFNVRYLAGEDNLQEIFASKEDDEL